MASDGGSFVELGASAGTSLAELSKQHIRPLLDLNDRINELTADERSINSTRIVVVGDQSHGKTSVLEALSGVDLPRGEGIKTRVPLILQLRCTPDGDEDFALIAVQGAEGQPERIKLSDVAAKVDEYTDKIAGAGKDVQDTPIDLKVFRHDADELTLVDLPGITRHAVAGQAGGDGKKLEQLITGLCRKYMTPAESVILNVVTAMVDFSTSASLQISRDVDPTGERTLLCVTKIDEFSAGGEGGFARKMEREVETMGMRPNYVFAVRNRTQEENDASLPLSEAREREQTALALHADLSATAHEQGFGLGVDTLSKQLVLIQCNRMRETLPAAQEKIREKLDELRKKMEQIGTPLEGEQACKLAAMSMIDQCIDDLKAERTGRLAQMATGAATDVVGKMARLQFVVDDLPKLREAHAVGSQVYSKPVKVGDITMKLAIYPSGYKSEEEEEEAKTSSVSVYLKCELPKQTSSIKVAVHFTADLPEKDVSEEFEREMEAGAHGFPDFMAAADAGCKPFTINALVHITGATGAKGAKMLCARLGDHNAHFGKSVASLHPDSFFASNVFRGILRMEASARQGGAGLPGTIAPEVPEGVIRMLQEKLPECIRSHTEAVHRETSDAVATSIARFVDGTAHPKLLRVLRSTTERTMDDQLAVAKKGCDKLLLWEDELHTSNHYFMTTVQNMREGKFPASIAGAARHIAVAAVKQLSNEEQQLVDLQHGCLAYWKTVKKRLIDMVQMAVASELSTVPIEKLLKPAMMATLEGVRSIEAIMSPDDGLDRERMSTLKRIANLEVAARLIREHDEHERNF
jgi:hypothetical protein